MAHVEQKCTCDEWSDQFCKHCIAKFKEIKHFPVIPNKIPLFVPEDLATFKADVRWGK